MKDIKDMTGITPQLREYLGQNVGAAVNATAKEFGDPYHHVTVITVPAFTQAVTSAALAFGKKIYDFPQGIIRFKESFLTTTIAAPVSTTTGEVALGTVVAAGAAATTGGTATFENILDGTAMTETSPTGAVSNFVFTPETDNPDGTTTALDLYLNIAGTWEAIENLTITATLVLFWDYLGDY